MLSPEQLEEAQREIELNPDTGDIVDIIIKKGFVSQDDLTVMLAQQYGMEMIDLSRYELPEEVISLLDRATVKKYGVIPLGLHDDILTIAMSDPTDVTTLDALRYMLGRDVDAVIAPKAQIEKIINEHYRSIADSVESMIGDIESQIEQVDVDSMIGSAEIVEDDATPIIRLVQKILADAYKMKASDIHMEPMEKRYRIRYRVDGALQEVDAPPKYIQANLTSRLKIMARLDITEKRIPQDGRIQFRVGDKDIDLRVSSIPTTFGESIVMRILDKASIQLDIPKLGFYSDDLELVNKIISMPDGIFLVTGPTGSGKTTSLYAFLNTINTPTRKIITVEDPVEYQLAGINQVQVDKTIDMTFAAALRSMLRQAPNIIMVGEIRDFECASIAINAALTGHLVFSTLHTNDAPGAITRLVDMGIKPFLVATAVRAVMAQRLLRRVCPNCKKIHKPTAQEIDMLQLTDEYLANHEFYEGEGCEVCHNTGYKGRIGIYEIFIVSEDLAKLIFANQPAGVIREAARKAGMRSLRDDAMRKAEAGISTLKEVITVTLMDEV
ncbi:MAG: Flp pilus assembly complex ATPase component TadA [Lentisphaeria bacterium]|nr:Flp pilus assembly complex ATPase component TadA [Lentisphaeria bacterium]